MSKTLVIVACGATKDDSRRPAKDLYTSGYFQKKRAYAELVADEWMICSAKHGLVAPDTPLEPYDTGIEDLDSDGRDEWAHGVGCTLSEWITHSRGNDDVERIEVLAGRRYIDPLQERGVFAALSGVPVIFPLQAEHITGIGDQMAWLEAAVSDAEPSPTCERCGRETTATTLGGDRLCEHCMADRREQTATRDANQHGLGAWSE